MKIIAMIKIIAILNNKYNKTKIIKRMIKYNNKQNKFQN